MAKLVRDRIPEIIFRDTRKSPRVRIPTSDSEYRRVLYNKLREEVAEFIKSQGIEKGIEELADILEVIDEICNFRRFNKAAVLEKQRAKALERGKFHKRFILGG